MFEGLILITGMGDSPQNSTDSWAQLLFPNGDLQTGNDFKWLQVNNRKIYLFEVYYDDLNQMLLAKYEGLQEIFDLAPDSVSGFLETHVHDVITNVLVPDQINASQLRFVEQYRRAHEAMYFENANPTNSKLGVLSHSLGTLVAYEGIYKAMSLSNFVDPIPMSLVMAAPMLSPICKVQSLLGLERYLTQNRSMKPYLTDAIGRRVTWLKKCLAIYNKKDPFYLIHNPDFYDRNQVNNDLVDEYVEYDEGPSLQNFNTHSLEESYIPNNKENIINTLLGD